MFQLRENLKSFLKQNNCSVLCWFESTAGGTDDDNGRPKVMVTPEKIEKNSENYFWLFKNELARVRWHSKNIERIYFHCFTWKFWHVWHVFQIYILFTDNETNALPIVKLYELKMMLQALPTHFSNLIFNGCYMWANRKGTAIGLVMRLFWKL